MLVDVVVVLVELEEGEAVDKSGFVPPSIEVTNGSLVVGECELVCSEIDVEWPVVASLEVGSVAKDVYPVEWLVAEEDDEGKLVLLVVRSSGLEVTDVASVDVDIFEDEFSLEVG